MLAAPQRQRRPRRRAIAPLLHPHSAPLPPGRKKRGREEAGGACAELREPVCRLALRAAVALFSCVALTVTERGRRFPPACPPPVPTFRVQLPAFVAAAESLRGCRVNKGAAKMGAEGVRAEPVGKKACVG